MKTIRTREELLALLDAQGKPTEPVTIAEGVWLSGLSSVTSLDGVTLAEGVGLSGLSSVTSLDGLTLGAARL